MSETFRKLIDAWKGSSDEQPYISTADKKVIDFNKIVDNKSSGRFNFEFQFLPQPWWGNIRKPEVIILALNPGVDNTEEYDEKNFKEEIIRNLLGEHTLNWMTEDDSSAHRWWKMTFKDLIEKGDIAPEEIYKKVGIFELVGYHSESFRSDDYSTLEKMMKNELGLKEGVLPTQQALFDHLNFLIKEYKPIVVIIWGQKFWRKKISLLESYDYIDTINTASHSLSIGNMRKIDFDRIVKALK